MTKTPEQMRQDWVNYIHNELFPGMSLISKNTIADYWFSIIEQRDKELREKIEKATVKVWNLEDKDLETALYAVNQTKEHILSLLSPHNKENER